VKLVNCLAFGNGYDFMFDVSSPMEFYNNVCFGRQEIGGGTESNNALGASSSKGWASAITGIGAADYEDLSETAAIAPRSADGSMPTGFARLRDGSRLIGAAKTGLVAPLPNIGIELFGSAFHNRTSNKDIGPYDKNPVTGGSQLLIDANARLSISVYPNPVQADAYIRFAVNSADDVQISLYNVQGQKVTDIASQPAVEGMEYFIPLNVNDELNSGIYILRLITSKGEQTQCKLIKK
jgi:hypothetical protein